MTGPLGPEVRRVRRVRTFFMDEARFGQQGTPAKVWARRGTRPVAVRQARYEYCYLYAAVEPATGASAALIAPGVDTGTVNRFLGILAAERAADEHLVLIPDQAGWHRAKGLVVPAGLSLLFLPPYSPELNPVENPWHYLRDHYPSNRAYADYDALFEAGTDAYRRLTPAVLKTVCGCSYLATRTD